MENSRKNKIKEAANFVEELSWVLEKKKKDLSLKDISNILRDISYIEENHNRLLTKSSSSPSSQYLVGVLPSLFLDEELFKNNSDLIDFAESVLDLSISKASKRSRTEYIGFIVCEIAKISSSKLSELEISLENIIGDSYKISQVKKAKKEPNFSWNDTINKLGKF